MIHYHKHIVRNTDIFIGTHGYWCYAIIWVSSLTLFLYVFAYTCKGSYHFDLTSWKWTLSRTDKIQFKRAQKRRENKLLTRLNGIIIPLTICDRKESVSTLCAWDSGAVGSMLQNYCSANWPMSSGWFVALLLVIIYFYDQPCGAEFLYFLWD